MTPEEIYVPSPGKRDASVVLHIRIPRTIASQLEILLDRNQGRIPWSSVPDVARSCLSVGLQKLEDVIGGGSPMWRVSELVRSQMALAADDIRSITQFEAWAQGALREGHTEEIRAKWVTMAEIMDKPGVRHETKAAMRGMLNRLAPALGLPELEEGEE